MPAAATFCVEPSELELAAKKIEKVAESNGHSLRQLAGVQHAQNSADSPEVAVAIMAVVDAWGGELANLTVFLSGMADKLLSAGSGYVSTDADAADWMQAQPEAVPPRPPAEPR